MAPPSVLLPERYHWGRVRRKALLVGVAAAAASAGAAWLRLRPFLARVQGDSMLPAVRPGALLAALRGIRPRRGAVVVVEHPERRGYLMVKRMEAGPMDEAMPGWVLGPDEWLLLGDNGPASTDSRSFGTFPSSAILGVVVWPRHPRRPTS